MSLGPTGSWRITLFGPIGVRAPSGAAVQITSRKAAELLAFLALRRNSIVDRTTLAAALWPDADEGAGRNRLKQTLAVLRNEVGDLPILTHGKNEIELARDRVEIDYQVMEHRLKWFRTLPPRDRSQSAHQMLEAVREGLLPGLTALWAQSDQVRYENLSREWSQIIRDTPRLANVAFRIGAELPGVRVPIVGREAVLAEIRAWLQATENRRLFLVGSPGVGKTRLLHEVIETSRFLFDAALCMSGSQDDESPWLESLGLAAGITSKDGITEDLARLLRDFEHPLLAFDASDSAPEGMQRWVEKIIGMVPRLRLIATGTETPAAGLFELVSIDPLPLNADGEPVAMRLLVEFAEQAGVPSATIRDNRETLRKLAERLDGLPAALESAAELLSLMSPAALLESFESRPETIYMHSPIGRQSLCARAQALLETLPVEARGAATLLSVCVDGAGESLAAALLGDSWPRLVQELVHHSVVRTSREPLGSRVRMLPSIRVSIFASLDPPTRIAAEVSLGEVCLRLGEAAARNFEQGDLAACHIWLRQESENLFSAVRWAAGRTAELDRCITLLARLRIPCGRVGLASDHAGIFRELVECAGREVNELTVEPFGPTEDRHTAGIHETTLASSALKVRRWFDAGEHAERAAESFRLACETAPLFDVLLIHAVAFLGQGAVPQAKAAAAEAAANLPRNDEERYAKLAVIRRELSAGGSTLPGELLVQIGDSPCAGG